MTNIIVAFSRPEDGKSIKNVLVKHGFDVCAVCSSGAQALTCADSLADGIVVCGSRFADMVYEELHDCLSPCFDMLVVASPSQLSGRPSEKITCLGFPLRVHDLVETVEGMARVQAGKRKKRREKPGERSQNERELIDRAKAVLIGRSHMTEAEAHRYMQKCSMEGGCNLVETAGKILRLME